MIRLRSRCSLCMDTAMGNSGLCTTCHAAIPQLPQAHCLRCRRPFSTQAQAAHRCADCLQAPPLGFRQLFCNAVYAGKLRELILAWKFGRKLLHRRACAHVLRQTMQRQRLPFYDCILAVPLHTSSLRKRGFNQAALLAETAAAFLKNRYERQGLAKLQAGTEQARLQGQQRQTNTLHIVACRSFHGERCLLVDDVYTSGMTANTCAKVLYNAGALVVDVLTLARSV